ncbi:hypothetical protein EVAR_20456_1 [Eumeta japonica]|uniref:Uncharacterized protein n=1 Tax=Eumeta variegata TaxID=151549 RepID=A0A4C1TYM6_EUMVA|nr:hypothetical protein EVAR_20456_1 [Eumeta japonica]
MVMRVKGETRIDIQTRTGTLEIEDEKQDRYHDGHVSTVDVNDVRIHSISTRAQSRENAIYHYNWRWVLGFTESHLSDIQPDITDLLVVEISMPRRSHNGPDYFDEHSCFAKGFLFAVRARQTKAGALGRVFRHLLSLREMMFVIR